MPEHQVNNRTDEVKTIALLVGEVSGDILAADLIRRVKQQLSSQYPQLSIRFIGIGGKNMISEGFQSLVDMDHLSIMGADVIRQLPKLLLLRARFIKQLIQLKPDLLIGIDAPDFNFAVERKLRSKGVLVWHWVSPSIWAWRRGRIKKIARSCDEIMCLFPQEPIQYSACKELKATFYGHPMADEIPLDTKTLQEQSFQKLQPIYPILSTWKDKTVIALLPGSRFGEVKYMLPLYLQVVSSLAQQNEQLRFILPIAKESLSLFFQQHYQNIDASLKDRVLLVEGHARESMSLSAMVLLASGTATLEAMLLKKPMLVAHQGPKLNHLIFKYLVYTPYVTLPNYMENDFLIKELLFDQASVPEIVKSIKELLANPEKIKHQIERFTFHHQQLKQNATSNISHKILEHITQHS